MKSLVATGAINGGGTSLNVANFDDLFFSGVRALWHVEGFCNSSRFFCKKVLARGNILYAHSVVTKFTAYVAF